MLKQSYTLEEKKKRSAVILNRLQQLPEFQRAQKVLLYWSLPDEVQTDDFVVELARTKQVYLPVVEGDELVIRPLGTSLDYFTAEGIPYHGHTVDIAWNRSEGLRVTVDGQEKAFVPACEVAEVTIPL